MVSFVTAGRVAEDRAIGDAKLRDSAIADSDVSAEEGESESEEDETDDDDHHHHNTRGRRSTDSRSTTDATPALSIQFAPTYNIPSQERKSLRKMINLAHARSQSFDSSNSRQASKDRRQNELEKRQRRSNPSPPPPPAFVNRVSFETFEGAADAQPFSLSLKSKHKDYTYSRYSRTFLCGLDTNDYSHNALEWLLDVLAEEGDEIVVLRVLDPGCRVSSEASRDDGGYLHEAKMLLDSVLRMNEDGKAIAIVVELATGKVTDVIQQMIHLYQPDSLIVGTRGRKASVMSILPGSISKFCLQNSPVPVIVVRPDRKRQKKKEKRLNDPSRRSYMELLGMLPSPASITPPSVLTPTGSDDNILSSTTQILASSNSAAITAAIPGRPPLYQRNSSPPKLPTVQVERTVE